MEKFGAYYFRILWDEDRKGWYYQISSNQMTVLRSSDEMFQYEGIARFAAIGHISLLENGEG
jgi:hypothetical protein